MIVEFLLRALWAVGIVFAGLGLYWLTNRLLLARVQDKSKALESLRPGVPAILYFTAPGCAPCKTVQRPALKQLCQQFGDGLQIIEINCADQPNLADYWGVLSVPTTFVIDSEGRPRRVNHGVARADKLLKQLEEVAPKRNGLERTLQIMQAD